MVLIGHELSGQPDVDLAENDNENRVDDTRKILPVQGHCIGLFIVAHALDPVHILKQDLGANDHADEGKTDWDTDGELALVGVFGGNLPLVLSVRVNCCLTLEVLNLSRGILETANKPFVTDVVLLALPTFIEEGDPDHDDKSIENNGGV